MDLYPLLLFETSLRRLGALPNVFEIFVFLRHW